MSGNKGSKENTIGCPDMLPDKRFFNKSENLTVVGQGYAVTNIEQFLKMPTRIAYWS